MSAKRYRKAIWNHFGYLANWLPTTPLQAGDIGVWSAEGFARVGDLRGKGMSFGTRTVEHPLDFTHREVKSAEVVGRGQGVVEGQRLGVKLQFASEGEFAFQAGGCRSTVIDGCEGILQRMKGLFRDGLWDDNYVVISEVMTAARATILLSQSSTASLELEGPKSLDDLLAVDLKVVGQQGTLTQIVAQAGLVPLFKALKVEKGWFGRVRSRTVHYGTDDERPVIVPVTPEDWEA